MPKTGVISKATLLSQCGILPRWHNKGFEDFTNDIKARKKAEAYAVGGKEVKQDGVGLYIYGANGCGKTHLAMSILKSLYEQGFSVRAVSLSTLINLQTIGWYEKDSMLEFKQYYQRNDFLLIEGVGKEYKSGQNELGATCLDTILYYRSQAKKPTIITSIYEPTKLKTVYNEDIASLLHEMVLLLKIEGKDNRVNIYERNAKKYGF